MRKFKIDKDYNGIGCKIYQKGTIAIQPGLTVLVGCNGIGKTTLMHQLVSQLKKADIPVIHFDNLRDGGSHARQSAFTQQDFTLAATSMCSSEGENINMNIGQFAGKLASFQRYQVKPDAKELWIFLDAVDSGLSVDNIIELKSFFDLIIEKTPNMDVFIIVAANEYELARGEACFDVLRGKYVKFSSYERYRNFILKTREEKNKRVYDDEEPIRPKRKGAKTT